MRVNDGSPLAAGVGPFAWVLDDARYVLTSGAGAGIPLRYPDAGSSDFFVSGQADGAAALGGRPAATDERVGSGRVVAFGFDPNYRAFADGTEKLLRNAMFGADPATARASAARAASTRRAIRATRRLTVAKEPLRLVVRARGARAAKRVLARFGATYRVQRARKRVQFVIANPGGAQGDEHPYARQLGRRAAGGEGAGRDVPRAVMVRGGLLGSPPDVPLEAPGLRTALDEHDVWCPRRSRPQRSFERGAYSSESHHARAAAVSGNSITHDPALGHSPSSVVLLAAADQEPAAVVGDGVGVAAAVLDQRVAVADRADVGDDIGGHPRHQSSAHPPRRRAGTGGRSPGVQVPRRLSQSW